MIMDQKYYLHRIQKEDGAFNKGIEVHNTKDAAILSFWGRMKLGYNNPQHQTLTYVSCKITDINGAVVDDYDMTWQKETGSEYFMHYIRLDGETYTKNIDICETFEAAIGAFAAAEEYGYSNPKFPNVQLVSCMITDRAGAIMEPFNKTWMVPDPEPAE